MYNDDGMRRLATAVAHKMVDDYKNCARTAIARRIKDGKTDNLEQTETWGMRSLERYIRDPWFYMLTGLDADWVMRMLHRYIKDYTTSRIEAMRQ